jgi:hypothetical protein
MRIATLVSVCVLFSGMLLSGQVVGTGSGGGGPIRFEQTRPAAPRTVSNAQPDASTPDAPVADPATIEGSVVSASGEPLRKADINLVRTDRRDNSPAAPHVTTSDETGRFVITGIEAGRYSLSAQRTGYVRQTYGARKPNGAGTVLTIAAGQKMKDLTIKMSPHGVVTGRVLDADGDPVTRAMVNVLIQRNVRGKSQWMPQNGGAVNDVGEYRIAGLAPGKYVLVVNQQRYNMAAVPEKINKDAVEEGYAATYYPNALDPAQATPVEITAGASMTGIDFRLAKTRVVRVRGKVIDGTTNKPAMNVNVMLTREGEFSPMMSGNMSFVRNAEGTFEISGVTPGSYILMANQMTNGKQLSAQLPVDVGSKNLENLVLTLNEGATLNGSVKVEGQNKPALGATRIMLEAVQPAGIAFSQPNGQVKEDGTFTLQGVMPGKFRVNVFNIPDGVYVKSVRLGTQEVLDSGLDFSGGVTSAPIEVVLNSNGATVGGTVQDSNQQRASGVMVVLVPELSKRNAPGMFKFGRTDQSGAFTIAGVPPGDYSAFAWEDLQDVSYMDPEFLKKYEAGGSTVKVKESESQNLQLKLIPAEKGTQD